MSLLIRLVVIGILGFAALPSVAAESLGRLFLTPEQRIALDKLLRLGLVRRDHEGLLHATPIDQALTALDRRWDDTFRYT